MRPASELPTALPRLLHQTELLLTHIPGAMEVPHKQLQALLPVLIPVRLPMPLLPLPAELQRLLNLLLFRFLPEVTLLFAAELALHSAVLPAVVLPLIYTTGLPQRALAVLLVPILLPPQQHPPPIPLPPPMRTAAQER